MVFMTQGRQAYRVKPQRRITVIHFVDTSLLYIRKYPSERHGVSWGFFSG
jgi:hypothetical protein